MSAREVFSPAMKMPGLTKARRRRAAERAASLMAAGAPGLIAVMKSRGEILVEIAREEATPGPQAPEFVAIARDAKALLDRLEKATFGKGGERIDVAHREVDAGMRALHARASGAEVVPPGSEMLMHFVCAATAARSAMPTKEYLTVEEMVLCTALMMLESGAIEAANVWCDRAAGVDEEDDGTEYELTLKGALFVMAELDPGGAQGRGRERIERVQARVAAVRHVFPSATTEQAIARAFDVPKIERRVEMMIAAGAKTEDAFERALDEALFGGAS